MPAIAKIRPSVVITTALLHSTKPELRFSTGSSPGCGMSEIRIIFIIAWLLRKSKGKISASLPQKLNIIFLGCSWNLRTYELYFPFKTNDLIPSKTGFYMTTFLKPDWVAVAKSWKIWREKNCPGKSEKEQFADFEIVGKLKINWDHSDKSNIFFAFNQYWKTKTFPL